MTETSSAFDEAVTSVRAGSSLDAETEALLAELTEEEKLWLLDGDVEFWDGRADMKANGYNSTPIVMGHVARLGIPGLRFSDGPRGVVVGRATAFPVPMARGATWDVDLEERVGVAIGREMRAQGANFFGGVCINLPRHPAWGRIQETYGEDPILLGSFGVALHRGVRRNAMTVAKHFALNSIENTRFKVDVTADDATLHEVYFPHFRRLVEDGVDGIMTAYNSVNGQWAGDSHFLMEETLRQRWGFQGVTVSDFIFGMRDAGGSLVAGLDVEEPFRQQRAMYLPDDLASGRVSWEHVDRAARRILRTQLAYYSSPLEDEPSPDVVFSDPHRALARETAATAAVLVKNEPVGSAPVLPLDVSSLDSLALIGRLSDTPNTGDHGSSDVRSPHVVTLLEGLRAALPGVYISHVGTDSVPEAVEAARSSQVAVVVVGYTAADEGESLATSGVDQIDMSRVMPPPPAGAPAASSSGAASSSVAFMGTAPGGDRDSLRLRPDDVALIRATARVNPRTVVVIVTAGAVLTEEWRDEVPAVLFGWYAGCEGGNGLADVLVGATDAAGRLPYSIPVDEEHLPPFDSAATAVTYDRWHGQRLLDRDGHRAAFPLGFGLSYTRFEITDLEVDPPEGEDFRARVRVTNTGERRGRHVVQLYGRIQAYDFPERVLLGFAPVWLDPGETAVVAVHGSTRPVQRWQDDAFVPAADTILVEAAPYAGAPDAPAAELVLGRPYATVAPTRTGDGDTSGRSRATPSDSSPRRD